KLGWRAVLLVEAATAGDRNAESREIFRRDGAPRNHLSGSLIVVWLAFGLDGSINAAAHCACRGKRIADGQVLYARKPAQALLQIIVKRRTLLRGCITRLSKSYGRSDDVVGSHAQRLGLKIPQAVQHQRRAR